MFQCFQFSSSAEQVFLFGIENWEEQVKQDPVSTMQETGWAIHSSFLVLSGLEKGFTLNVITRGQSLTISLCIGPFSAW